MILFALAFAWCESATVFYLREQFYPGGFTFPIVEWEPTMLWVEIGREIATVIIMAVIALLAGRSAWSRFGWFMFIFGFWDIFYYIWLHLFEGWPSSLFTDDLLFLVPVPWAGPVFAPILVSVGLIICGTYILLIGEHFRPSWTVIALTLAGWIVILVSFMWHAPAMIAEFTAGPFRWDIYLIGMAMWIVGIVLMFLKNRSTDAADPSTNQ